MKIYKIAQQSNEFVGIDRFYEGQEIEVCRGSQKECWTCLLERALDQHGTSWDFAVKNNLMVVMPADEWVSQGLANNMIGEINENY